MIKPAFLIAFFTTIVRYYDYALFGLSATTLAKNFLPPNTNHTQILLFYTIYSIAVMARPIGSIIFGFIGDKYGRVHSVKISVLLATSSTVLIGLTPDFETIGVLATLILTFCRMIFLISLAGDSDGIKIHVVEKVGKPYKNYANGIIVCCSQVGALLAAGMYYLASEFSIKYLWRINFIIGGIFGLSIIFMRHYFEESEEFLKYKNIYKSAEIKFFDVKNVLKDEGKRFIVALIISGILGGIYHFLVIFWGVFSSQIALVTSSQAKIMNILLIIIYGIISIFSGKLADRFSPKSQIIISLLLSILVIIIVQFFGYYQKPLIYFPIILIFLLPFYMTPLQIIVQSLFLTSIRNRMYSLAHSVGGMLISSTTPFFCMMLWQYSNSLHLILGFLLLLILLLFITVKICFRLENFKGEKIEKG